MIITVHVYFESGEEEEILRDIQKTSFHEFCKKCDIDPNISTHSTGNFECPIVFFFLIFKSLE